MKNDSRKTEQHENRQKNQDGKETKNWKKEQDIRKLKHKLGFSSLNKEEQETIKSQFETYSMPLVQKKSQSLDEKRLASVKIDGKRMLHQRSRKLNRSSLNASSKFVSLNRLEYLWLRLNVGLSGIVSFFQENVKKKFLCKTVDNVYKAVKTLRGMESIAFHGRDDLDNRKNEFNLSQQDFLLLEMLKDFEKSKGLVSLKNSVQEMIQSSFSSIPLNSVQEELNEIYKYLRIFFYYFQVSFPNLFHQMLKNLFLLGMIPEGDRKETRKSMDWCFEKLRELHVELHFIFCLQQKHYISMDSVLVDKIVGIDTSNMLTSIFREVGNKVQEENRGKENFGNVSKEDEDGTRPISLEEEKNKKMKNGFALMLRFFEDSNNVAEPLIPSVFSSHDKVGWLFGLVQKFDEEFGFVLTSNLIDLHSLFRKGKKINVREDLIKIDVALNQLYLKLQLYVRLLKGFTGDEDIFDEFHEKRKKNNHVVRMEYKKLFEDLFVATDAILNVSGILVFSEKKIKFPYDRKYVNNLKAREIFQLLCDYVEAIGFLLSKGPLSGADPDLKVSFLDFLKNERQIDP